MLISDTWNLNVPDRIEEGVQNLEVKSEATFAFGITVA